MNFSNSSISLNEIERATNSIRHRGPDSYGYVNFTHCSLWHRRLSIIDLEKSIQPFRSPDGRYAMVFNGEIYNYVELRSSLEKRGVKFSTSGDTEVLLWMFLLYGENGLSRLNGMFAFAIWDDVKRELFIARDRLGKKPIFYYQWKNTFYFCSELIGLKQFSKIDLSISRDSVGDFFAYQYIPAPNTIYQYIHKLPAGHWIKFNSTGTKIHRYWHAPNSDTSQVSFNSSSSHLRELILDATKLRLRSDVPTGAFLSGGIDSSIIISAVKQLGETLNTFTAGFDSDSYDERENATHIAEHYKFSNLNFECHIDPQMLIPKIVAHTGEPFADPSALPTWLLCQETKRHVTVALSGDGADELFGGYRRYQAYRLASLYNKLPRKIRSSVILPIVNNLSIPDTYYGHSYKKKLLLFLRLTERLDQSPDDLLAQTFNLNERQQLLTGYERQSMKPPGLGTAGVSSNLERMVLSDIEFYLSENILTKTDRMSMAHSLEVRSPFLDYRIVEYACRLPMRFKIRFGVQKYILRKAFERYLPKQVMVRPKHGFAVPLDTWFRGNLGLYFNELFNHSDRAYDFICKTEVKRIFDAHQTGRVSNGHKLWSLLIFLEWINSEPHG